MSELTLAQKLLAIQKELPRTLNRDGKATVPTKSGGQYSYKYVTLDQVLEKVVPVLNKHGLYLYDQVGADESGNQFLTVNIADSESDASITSKVLLPKVERMQEWGSSVTYARRYALMPLLGLVGDEDDDGNTSQSIKPVVKTLHSTPKQQDFIKEMLRRKGAETLGDVKKILNQVVDKDSIDALDSKEASTVIEFLTSTPSEQIKEITHE